MPGGGGLASASKASRPASAQHRFDLLEPEFRRLGEWPVAPAPHQWRLLRIDPVSITLERVVGPRASPRVPPMPRETVPAEWRSVLVCGAAAPVAAAMLGLGARRVEGTMLGFEPLLLLCELDGNGAQLGAASFPALLARQEVRELLLDRQTRLDAVVWYDIGGARCFLYLKWITETRDALRSSCPILRLAPCPSAESAEAELLAVRRESSAFLAAADELYRRLLDAVAASGDVAFEDPLQRLLKGGISVVWTDG